MQRQCNNSIAASSLADLPSVIQLNSMTNEMKWLVGIYLRSSELKPLTIDLIDSVRVTLEVNKRPAQKSIYFSAPLVRFRSKNKNRSIRYAVQGDEVGKGAFCKVYKCEKTLKLGADGEAVCKVKEPGKLRVIKIFTNPKLISFAKIEYELLKLIPSMRVKSIETNPQANQAALLMAYIPGEDLEACLKAHKNKSKPLSILQRLELSRELVIALHRVHESNIIHRDVKAANIIVSFNEDGSVKCATFLDFNLGKKKGVAPNGMDNVGTLQFASPEAVSLNGVQDEKSDLYSLGRVLWNVWGLGLNFYEKFNNINDSIRYYRQLTHLPFLFSDVSPEELSLNLQGQLHDMISLLNREMPAERPNALRLMYFFDTLIEDYRLEMLVNEINNLPDFSPVEKNAATSADNMSDQDSDDHIASRRPYSKKAPALLFSTSAAAAPVRMPVYASPSPLQHETGANAPGCVLF